MKSLLQWALLSLLVMSLGCAQKSLNSPPAWVMQPGNGVVASCGFHIKGRYAQEECARQRARERLAAREGVEFSSVSTSHTKVKDDRNQVNFDQISQETVTKVNIKARVVASWYDAQRDEYYVLMEAE